MKPAKLVILIFSLLTLPNGAKGGDIVSTPSDVRIYEAYIKQFEKQKDKPFGEILINTAKYFLGKPYVAYTLEIPDTERMVVNLREFDCTTFVENCIALSQVTKSGDFSYNNYLRTLMTMRYRDGEVAGYTSRLHYTSDWIYENEKHGLLRDISSETGGEKVKKDINFMTTHPQLYKHLKNNARNIEELDKIEKDISKRNAYEILPIAAIYNNQHKIRTGDIIVFATSVTGLDYSHIGIAYWQNKELHFIHASSSAKQVVIEKKTLPDYCKTSKSCTGITILRINQK
ncbi:N-acetylmuramoyl-L-alanine amidase-like domain-containing protein [Dysgonomonas termitidis]|uniref:N-acetylmuramoyl-L-alanine amidase-like domain-containing protein n=1 Tax=Dysgonomonas termitidis TaxID=1516126 RepID=A0ABV9KXU0_9BACT